MLYLAEITLQKTRYMGETTKKSITRLVEADDEASAETKVRNAFEHGAPGDDSCYVWQLELHSVIS